MKFNLFICIALITIHIVSRQLHRKYIKVPFKGKSVHWSRQHQLFLASTSYVFEYGNYEILKTACHIQITYFKLATKYLLIFANANVP